MEKRKIENKADFLAWAQEANTFLKPKQVADLQDVFARSDMSELKKIFLDDSPEDNKRLLIFAASKIMGEEPVYSLLKCWAKRQAQKVIDADMEELNKQWEDLHKNRFEFEKEREEIIRLSNARSKEICDLKERLSVLQYDYTFLANRKSAIESENERLREVIAENNMELEKTYQFKNYIREVMATALDNSL